MKFIIIAVIALLLSGCGETIVYRDHFVLLVPEDKLLQDCPSEVPPDRDAYVAASAMEQKSMLATYGVKQTGNLNGCNIDKASLRQWKKDQVENYQKKQGDQK